VTGGDAVVEQLKGLQEKLGGLTDGHELEMALQDAANANDGYIAALQLLREEREAVMRKLRDEWPEAGPHLARAIDAIGRQLRPLQQDPPSMRQPPRRSRSSPRPVPSAR
jgi:hypothetical protein